MSNKKYRPYLTVEQMQRIQSIFATFSEPTVLDITIEKYMRKYLRDIDEGFLQPNYSVNPIKNARQANNLGFTEEETLAAIVNEPLESITTEQLMLLISKADELQLSQERQEELNHEYMKREFGIV